MVTFAGGGGGGGGVQNVSGVFVVVNLSKFLRFQTK